MKETDKDFKKGLASMCKVGILNSLNKVNRFNFNSNNVLEAKNYIKNRAIQLLKTDTILKDIISFEWGIRAIFTLYDKHYQSLYIYTDFRGKGYYKANLLPNTRVITTEECKITTYLYNKTIGYIEKKISPYKEYDMIDIYYGSKIANRSGQYLMNHIDEGLFILNSINASNESKQAYCLHPIFQGDSDLLDNNHKSFNIDSNIMMLTMEYRSVANEYLSTRTIKSIDEIRLSPLKCVNDMLIADKVQNKKDFMLYHYGKHKRSEELLEYFDNWHLKLGVDVDMWKLIPNYNKF